MERLEEAGYLLKLSLIHSRHLLSDHTG